MVGLAKVILWKSWSDSRPQHEDGEISKHEWDDDEERQTLHYCSPLQHINNAYPDNWGMFYPPLPHWAYDPHIFQQGEEDVENDGDWDTEEELDQEDDDNASVSHWGWQPD